MQINNYWTPKSIVIKYLFKSVLVWYNCILHNIFKVELTNEYNTIIYYYNMKILKQFINK